MNTNNTLYAMFAVFFGVVVLVLYSATTIIHGLGY